MNHAITCLNVYRCLHSLKKHFNFEMTLTKIAALSCIGDKPRRVATVSNLIGVIPSTVSVYFLQLESAGLCKKHEGHGAPYEITNMGTNLLTAFSYAAKGEHLYEAPPVPVPATKKECPTLDSVLPVRGNGTYETNAPAPYSGETFAPPA